MKKIDGNPSSLQQEWVELRHCLMGPEIRKVGQLEERLDDPIVRAREISQILPDAITFSGAQDNKIFHALQPTIDQSIKVSVEKNPQVLAEAIFPALGPGIRKAIRATIAGMIQSLNTILNHSLSIHSIKWRIEALKTRTSFAEVLLFHTLVFRVEQIFLIHRSTGIVLQHVEADGTDSRDPDLVSGMLTAIQDFMNDSFQSENKDEIETMRMGRDRSIWVEQGSKAIIAIVIRGRPPLELRQKYREIIDTIHLRYMKYLDEFSGDITPFSVTKDMLVDGLDEKVKDKITKTISPVLIIFISIIIFAFGIWAYTFYSRYLKFDDYCQKLKAEPGIVVLQTSREKGRYVISCLRDPLARDTTLIAQESGLGASDITHKWEPYYALDPRIITVRVLKWLAPPETVRLVIKNGIVFASGFATNAWINNFCKRAMLVPGINDYNTTELNNTDLEKMNKAIKDLSSIKIIFDRGTSLIRKDNIEILDKAVGNIKVLQKTGPMLDMPLRIIIFGYADASGNEILNKSISLERAKKALQYLISCRVSPNNLSAEGLGTHPKARAKDKTSTSELHRIATFNIVR